VTGEFEMPVYETELEIEEYRRALVERVSKTKENPDGLLTALLIPPGKRLKQLVLDPL